MRPLPRRSEIPQADVMHRPIFIDMLALAGELLVLAGRKKPKKPKRPKKPRKPKKPHDGETWLDLLLP